MRAFQRRPVTPGVPTAAFTDGYAPTRAVDDAVDAVRAAVDARAVDGGIYV